MPETNTKTVLNSRMRNRGVQSVEELTVEVVKLQQMLEEVKREIADNYSEGELQEHIEKLHQYNEVKDMGQLLLGKLAEVEGTTTTALYDQFGLELND